MPLFPLSTQNLSQPATPASDQPQTASNDVFQIGEFLVGGGDTSNLGGHPDIRY